MHQRLPMRKRTEHKDNRGYRSEFRYGRFFPQCGPAFWWARKSEVSQGFQARQSPRHQGFPATLPGRRKPGRPDLTRGKSRTALVQFTWLLLCFRANTPVLRLH